ncbi:MAG: sulfatase-like hydrolase/transferase [Caulobacteraceae bacterium]
MRRAATFVALALIVGAARPVDAAPAKRPNILVIMADDLGFSDIGPFGSEIRTPNLDALARQGRLMTSMYATPMPHTSHAEFLFGVDHHVTVDRFSAPGATAATSRPGADVIQPKPLAQTLREAGYRTYMIGTWDSGGEPGFTPKDRGFDASHALMSMAGDYYPPSGANVPSPQENFRYLTNNAATPRPERYITDLWTDELIGYIQGGLKEGKPFFAYAAYTTPHFPLHAPDDAIARQHGRYDAGYDAVRLARVARQKAKGLFPASLRPATPSTAARYKRWSQLSPAERAVEARRMEVYAAMVENLDWNVGRLVKALKASGAYDNTLIVFTSSNGAAQAVATHRDPVGFDNSLANMGKRNSWIAYTERWAEVSNAPFAGWKAKGSEGGIVVPTIVKLPGQKTAKPVTAAPALLRDLVPTILDVAGAPSPTGPSVQPYTGVSLLPLLEGRAATARPAGAAIVDEHRDEAYVRDGQWKAVLISDTPVNAFDGSDPGNAEYLAAVKAGDTAKAAAIRARHPSVWKLYDIAADRGETTDLAAKRPEVLKRLIGLYDDYRRQYGAVAAR